MPTPKGKFEFTAKDLTKSAFNTIGKSLKSVTGSVFSLKTALVAVAGAAGFGLLIKSNLSAIDVLGKTADKLGITVEGLTRLQLAADIAGTSSNTLTKSIQKMVVGIGEANIGIGQSKQAFATLGISIEDVIKLNPEQQFGVLADALNKVENNTQKLTLAYEIFGARGTELLNIVSLGKDGLEAIGREAEIFGLTMSRETVAGVEAANDSITRLGSIFKGFSRQLTAALAPAIDEVTQAFSAFILETAESEGGIRSFAQSFAIDLLEGFKAGVEGIQTFLKFIDKAKVKLIEFGIIDNTAQEKRIAGIKAVIKIQQERLIMFDRLNVARRPDIIEALAVAQEKLNKELGREINLGDRIVDTLQRIIDKTKEKQAADAVAGPGGVKTPDSGKQESPLALGLPQDVIDARLNAVRSFLASQSEAIAASLLSDDEKLLAAHERRTLIVQEAAARDVITETRKTEILAGLSKKLATEQLKIEKDKEKAKTALQVASLQGAAGILRSLTTLVGSSSRKQFELGKKLARASVIIDTAAGISKVIGQGGFAGIIAAIGVAATGAAQLATINRTSFGGGGGISSGGINFPSPTAGDVPAINAPPSSNETTPREVIVNIIIEQVIGEQKFVEEMIIPAIKTAVNQSGVVLIEPESQNGLELAASA